MKISTAWSTNSPASPLIFDGKLNRHATLIRIVVVEIAIITCTPTFYRYGVAVEIARITCTPTFFRSGVTKQKVCNKPSYYRRLKQFYN